MAQGIDPSDGFLAQIAPLLKADGFLRTTDFLSQIVLADVNAIKRKAGLDSQCMKHRNPRRANVGRHQSVPQARHVFAGKP